MGFLEENDRNHAHNCRDNGHDPEQPSPGSGGLEQKATDYATECRSGLRPQCVCCLSSTAVLGIKHVADGTGPEDRSSGSGHAADETQNGQACYIGCQRAPCVEYGEEDKSNDIYDTSTIRLRAWCKIQRPETEAEYVESDGQSGQIDVRDMEVFSQGKIGDGKKGGGDRGDGGLGADYQQVGPLFAIAPVSRVERVVGPIP